MRIAIVNHKNSDHKICRMDGTIVNVPKGSYVIVDLEDNVTEINYWTKMSSSTLATYGLSVLSDEYSISNLIRKHNNYMTQNNTVSVFDSGESPIARQIANVVDDPEQSDDVPNIYSEEYLMSLSKEELMSILDEKGIKYRKNNSVKTLVSKVLETAQMPEN